MEWTNLVRPVQLQQLIANYQTNLPLKGTRKEIDFHPVTRMFNPMGVGTWILSECDDDGLAFGLCDVGYPELGYVSMQELWELRLPGGLKIEEDLHWTASKSLTAYADDARQGKRV